MTFSIERYKEESRKLDTTGVQWDETTRHKLSNGDLFCLHHMMDIENHFPFICLICLSPAPAWTRS